MPVSAWLSQFSARQSPCNIGQVLVHWATLPVRRPLPGRLSAYSFLAFFALYTRTCSLKRSATLCN